LDSNVDSNAGNIDNHFVTSSGQKSTAFQFEATSQNTVRANKSFFDKVKDVFSGG